MAAFHTFPRLPAELRLQIWHLAAQPRLLVIGKASADATDFTSPTRPPPLTQACREARTSGPYEKAFFSSGSPPRYAWANFDLDTIHVDCAHICRDDLCGVFPERASIQCLQAEATGDDFGWISDNCLLFSPQGFGAFPQLRRFDLVVDFDLALWAGFIGDTYFGPRCPRANVRVICAPTGEWIGESTSRWYGDWYSLHVADFEPARRLEPGEDDYYRSEVCPSQFIVPWAYSPLAGGEATEQTEDAASLMALAEASWLEEAMHAVEIDGSMA